MRLVCSAVLRPSATHLAAVVLRRDAVPRWSSLLVPLMPSSRWCPAVSFRGVRPGTGGPAGGRHMAVASSHDAVPWLVSYGVVPRLVVSRCCPRLVVMRRCPRAGGPAAGRPEMLSRSMAGVLRHRRPAMSSRDWWSCGVVLRLVVVRRRLQLVLLLPSHVVRSRVVRPSASSGG